MKCDVITLENKKSGSVELDDSVFGVAVRKDILARMVNYQLAKRRSGNHKTKTISEIRGTTAKPWNQKGTGRAANFGYMAAGKSGTSQQSRDAWFIGYTDKLVTGVWLGNDNNSPMKQKRGRSITGGGIPAEIWKTFMSTAHEALPLTCK